MATVVATAIDLGLDSFNVLAVASRLGVSDGTIYNYIGNRERLHSLACAAVYSRLDVVAPQAVSWSGYLEVIANRAVELAIAHPGLARYINEGPYEDDTLRVQEAIIDEVVSRYPGISRDTGYVLASRVIGTSMLYASSADVRNPVVADALAALLPWMRRALLSGMAAALASGDVPVGIDWSKIAESFRVEPSRP